MKFGTMNLITDISECDEKFRRLREMGFDACQLIYKPEVFTIEASKAIRNAADRYDIDISAQFAGFRDIETAWQDIRFAHRTVGIGVPAYRMERIKYVRATIDFAAMTGIDEIIIHAGFIPNDAFAPEYADMLTAVDAVARHAEQRGVDLLLETGTETPIALLGFIEDLGCPNVYINFDPANILMYGYGNPVDALKVFGKYVRNMHGKDGCLPTVPHKLGEERALGEGMVDFPTIFKEFEKLGYDRYCIIEREIGGDEQIRDILRAKDYLTSLVKA